MKKVKLNAIIAAATAVLGTGLMVSGSAFATTYNHQDEAKATVEKVKVEATAKKDETAQEEIQAAVAEKGEMAKEKAKTVVAEKNEAAKEEVEDKGSEK